MTGIYCIRNKGNDRIYIGCSEDIVRRLGKHLNLLEHYKHPNRYLQADYKETGITGFTLEVLDLCDRKDLREKELNYISKLSEDDYNIRRYTDTNDPYLHVTSQINELTSKGLLPLFLKYVLANMCGGKYFKSDTDFKRHLNLSSSSKARQVKKLSVKKLFLRQEYWSTYTVDIPRIQEFLNDVVKGLESII